MTGKISEDPAASTLTGAQFAAVQGGANVRVPATLFDSTYVTAAAVAAGYQPLDADLTALAALSGTDTIYYRSAASTWSAVVIGSNLSFTGGTLDASSGASEFSDSAFRVQDNGDATKQLAFQVSGISTGTTRTLTAPNASGTVALTADLSAYQPLDTTLTALAAYNTNGLIAQTAADTFAGRTLTAPAAGITVSNGNGVSGNPTLALADDLAALEALSGTSTIYYRSGASAWTAVTIGSGLSFTGGTLDTAAGTGQPVPTASPYAVGTMALLLNNSGGSVSNNATTAGSGLLSPLVAADGTLTGGGAQSGTWKNISGGTIINTSAGYFVRTV